MTVDSFSVCSDATWEKLLERNNTAKNDLTQCILLDHKGDTQP